MSRDKSKQESKKVAVRTPFGAKEALIFVPKIKAAKIERLKDFQKQIVSMLKNFSELFAKADSPLKKSGVALIKKYAVIFSKSDPAELGSVLTELFNEYNKLVSDRADSLIGRAKDARKQAVSRALDRYKWEVGEGTMLREEAIAYATEPEVDDAFCVRMRAQAVKEAELLNLFLQGVQGFFRQTPELARMIDREKGKVAFKGLKADIVTELQTIQQELGVTNLANLTNLTQWTANVKLHRFLGTFILKLNACNDFHAFRRVLMEQWPNRQWSEDEGEQPNPLADPKEFLGYLINKRIRAQQTQALEDREAVQLALLMHSRDLSKTIAKKLGDPEASYHEQFKQGPYQLILSLLGHPVSYRDQAEEKLTDMPLLDSLSSSHMDTPSAASPSTHHALLTMFDAVRTPAVRPASDMTVSDSKKPLPSSILSDILTTDDETLLVDVSSALGHNALSSIPNTVNTPGVGPLLFDAPLPESKNPSSSVTPSTSLSSPSSPPLPLSVSEAIRTPGVGLSFFGSSATNQLSFSALGGILITEGQRVFMQFANEAKRDEAIQKFKSLPMRQGQVGEPNHSQGFFRIVAHDPTRLQLSDPLLRKIEEANKVVGTPDEEPNEAKAMKRD